MQYLPNRLLPRLAFSLLAFAPVGNVAAQTFTLQGNMNDTLTVPRFQTAQSFYTLNFPGESVAVTIELFGSTNFRLRVGEYNQNVTTQIDVPADTPVDIDQHAVPASIDVFWNALADKETATLKISNSSGTQSAVIIGISQPSTDLQLGFTQTMFQNVAIGTTDCEDIPIYNFTGHPVTISDIWMSGSYRNDTAWIQGCDFAVVKKPDLPYTIADRDSVSFTLCYSPVEGHVSDFDSVFIEEKGTNGDITIYTPGIWVQPLAASSVHVPNGTSGPALIPYPNPATTHVTLRGLSTCNYSVYDELGRTVLQGKIGEGYLDIDIEGLPPGLYSITLSTGERCKFVKAEQ